MTKVNELIKYAKQENADFSVYALSQAGIKEMAIKYYNENADEIDGWLDKNGYDSHWLLKTTSVMIYLSESGKEIEEIEEDEEVVVPDNVVKCFRCGSSRINVRAEHSYTTEFKCLDCAEKNVTGIWVQYND